MVSPRLKSTITDFNFLTITNFNLLGKFNWYEQLVNWHSTEIIEPVQEPVLRAEN